MKSTDEIIRALRSYASDCYDDDACSQCTFAWMCNELDGNAPTIIADTIEHLQYSSAAYEDTGLAPDEIPHWVPASERLPEPETNVLILQSYREDAPYSPITIGHLHQESDLRGKPYWMWIAYGADMVNPKIEAYHRADFICPGNEFVTHWMPLPQPPKEEK
jgi:hypothetical protein